MIAHMTPEGEARMRAGQRRYWDEVKQGLRPRPFRHRGPVPSVALAPAPPIVEDFVPRPSEARICNYLRALWRLAAEEGIDPKRIIPLLQHEQPV